MAGLKVVFHSVLSGIFAASAGVAGKLAFDKPLILDGCFILQNAFESSSLWSWIQQPHILGSLLFFTNVCDIKVRPYFSI